MGKTVDLKKKMGDLQRIFQNQFLIIDNTDPNNVDFSYYTKELDKFLKSPPTKLEARKWITYNQ